MDLTVAGGEKAVARVVVRVAESLGHTATHAAAPAALDTCEALIDLGLSPAELAAAPDPVAAEAERARRIAAALPAGRPIARQSMLGSSPGATGWLKRASAAAEEELAGRAVFLRVGVLLGDCGLTAAIRRRLEGGKIFPVPGLAHARLEPIGVEDFARYAVATVTGGSELDEIYDLGCGEMMTAELLVRELAENLGLERWIVPLPGFFRGAVASWLATPELPARWMEGMLEALPGLLPRRMNAWEHFEVKPVDLRVAMAAAAGMEIPLRRRGSEEGDRFAWKRPRKKGILWTKPRS